MDPKIRQQALTKLAFFGSAFVSGAPSYLTPPLSVGQALYNVNSSLTNNTNNNTNNVYVSAPRSALPNADSLYLNAAQRRSVSDKIVGTGINVNAPAKSLLHAGIGALAGNFIANALHTGPFVRGLMTATGANYGYHN